MDQKRSLKDILLFCTFLSGWAALTYEILWVRLFSLVFGHTTFAISTVLAAFMAGLALGSWAGGRWADSGKWNLAKAYAVCEIGIGVFGLLSKHLIRLLEAALVGLGIGQWFFWWQSLGWFIVLFLLLLPPTFFMGATLPILVVWAKKTGRSASQNMAVFYGVNTAGASLGTLAAGLWLASELGITWTLIGAVFLNVLAAALAWRVAQLERGQVLNYAGNGVRSSFVTCYNKLWPPFSSCQQVTNEDLTPLQSEERARYFRAAAAVGLGGFAALIFEVGWTRALAFSLGSSIYAFTIMLFTFLAGLTLGSLSPFSPKSNLFGLGLIEFAIAVCAFGSLFILGRMPYVFCRLYPVLSKSFHFFEAGLFALSCLVILLPTFLMGAALPWALCAAKGRGGEGARLGGLYASNTFGSILGSVLAGFILIPAMGVEKTLIIGILANTAAGLTAWSQNLKNIRRSALFALASLIIVMAAAFAPRWNKSVMASGMFIYADEHEDSRPWRKFVQAMEADELLYYQDGISATISVFEEDTGNRYLRTNGKTDASSSRDMETQLMTGYLPLLLHPNPKKAMVIGLGSGTSLGAIVQGATIERADCAEIEPAVAGAAKLFQKQNNNVLANPKTRLWFTDARHFLASVKNRYDVIASEPSNPWVAGVANLYSREAFGQVKKALAPGGIFCQWIHSYSMSEADFKMILATFRSVFPNPQLFNIGDVDFLILGSNGPWNIDYDQVAENLRRTPAALAALKPYGLDDPLTFLTKDFMLTSRDIEKYTAGITRLNTDDAPVLEFSAPKSLYVTDEQEKIVRSLKRRRSALHPDGLVNLPAGRVLGLKTKKAYKKPKTRNRN